MNLAKITEYPGGYLIAEGIDDYAVGKRTIPACLVAIAASTLRQIGLPISDSPSHIISEPEHQLYELLRLESGDAYSQYNAFLRQLTSFIRAAHAIEG
ncbi:MAG: hypothetical protein L7V86_24960 [Verrucomicrobiales bacterium]|jgi:hypothetical protein|nr:hypothetical protein [Verrucomicrobiales bacterium]MDB2346833.1 hypothetical protein [Verrucomicrobiales bacterium]